MIIWFEDPKQEIKILGGKGIHLQAMYQEGINVPNGFSLSSTAYDAYVKKYDLMPKIKKILCGDESYETQSLAIKEYFTVDKLSAELKETLLRAFDKLNSPRVAVRSSSTMEDLESSSFAGQYSSFLGVTKEDFLEQVVACWQSSWNERVLAYRDQHGEQNTVSHAVVIQLMVESTVSGVLFTANPVSGSRRESVINASFGIGEAIVSGEVMPDAYIYSHKSHQIVKEDIQEKSIQYVYNNKGIEKQAISGEVKTKASLNKEMIEKLVKVGKRLELLFGKAQDIEFAFDSKGDLYILQSRAITTLFPIDAFERDNKLRAYMAASSVLLGMKEAFTPLGADVYGGMFPKVIETMTKSKKKIPTEFVKYAACRIYLDISYLLSSRLVSKGFANAFSESDLPLKRTMDILLKNHGKEFRHQGIRFKIPWGIFKYSFSMMGPYLSATKLNGQEKVETIYKLGDETIKALKSEALSLESMKDKVNFTEDIMLRVFMLTQEQAMYCTEVSTYGKIEKKIKKVLGNSVDISPLTYTLPNCITVEMSRALNKLAQYFDEHKEEIDPNHPQFKTYLERFGHRATVELDLGTPRWRENPAYLIDQVNQYMIGQAYIENLKAINEGKEKAEAFMENVYQIFLNNKGKRAAQSILEMMKRYRNAAGMREYPKFCILQGLDIGRSLLKSVGSSWVDRGLINHDEDIFYLHKEDILKTIERIETLNTSDIDINEVKNQIKSEVQKNKIAYKKEMKRTRIPRFVLNTGETFYSALPENLSENLLTGYPLSSGIVEGVIRLVDNPQESKLKKGEIMVTESTNPAWTPLFMTAGGLIMTYGGPLSHGGIVAREYGIPAVVGIADATEVFKDGQRVRIDGGLGTVEILN